MTFGVFGCACFSAYLWATYVVPETANVSLEMIDEVFKSPAGQEDILAKRQVRMYTSSILTIHRLSFLPLTVADSGGTRYRTPRSDAPALKGGWRNIEYFLYCLWYLRGGYITF